MMHLGPREVDRRDFLGQNVGQDASIGSMWKHELVLSSAC